MASYPFDFRAARFEMHEREDILLSMVFLHYEIMNHDLFTTLWTLDRKGFFPGWSQNCAKIVKSIDWFVFLFPPEFMRFDMKKKTWSFRENFQCQYLIIPFVKFRVFETSLNFEIPTYYRHLRVTHPVKASKIKIFSK